MHLLREGGIRPAGPRIIGPSLVEHEEGDVPPIEMEQIVVERGHRVAVLVPRALQDDVGDALRGAALERCPEPSVIAVHDDRGDRGAVLALQVEPRQRRRHLSLADNPTPGPQHRLEARNPLVANP